MQDIPKIQGKMQLLCVLLLSQNKFYGKLWDLTKFASFQPHLRQNGLLAGFNGVLNNLLLNKADQIDFGLVKDFFLEVEEDREAFYSIKLEGTAKQAPAELDDDAFIKAKKTKIEAKAEYSGSLVRTEHFLFYESFLQKKIMLNQGLIVFHGVNIIKKAEI